MHNVIYVQAQKSTVAPTEQHADENEGYLTHSLTHSFTHSLTYNMYIHSLT